MYLRAQSATLGGKAYAGLFHVDWDIVWAGPRRELKQETHKKVDIVRKGMVIDVESRTFVACLRPHKGHSRSGASPSARERTKMDPLLPRPSRMRSDR